MKPDRLLKEFIEYMNTTYIHSHCFLWNSFWFSCVLLYRDFYYFLNYLCSFTTYGSCLCIRRTCSHCDKVLLHHLHCYWTQINRPLQAAAGGSSHFLWVFQGLWAYVSSYTALPSSDVCRKQRGFIHSACTELESGQRRYVFFYCFIRFLATLCSFPEENILTNKKTTIVLLFYSFSTAPGCVLSWFRLIKAICTCMEERTTYGVAKWNKRQMKIRGGC